ncbi:M24 family metallopeptidase [Sphingomonas quercus]|uniref:Xaa-Pro peptidase family protein n=1 Tax=Sphingomonas quercus TaxID=2842451 RepID=A0ABS6BPM8_9SPHN|nr:Xaa-Pro peptidase family protein [Sphingomonas quercus]MBU3079165.1 Xaa-Pro peptidase family protein [Sphingomonas quercus]
MMFSRRAFVRAAAALPILATPGLLRAAEPDLSTLRPMTGDVVPIGPDERARRLARAQQLMRVQGLAAVLIEPGSSLVYFTGIRWGRSERAMLAVLPVEGQPCIVSPFFEEPRMRETLAVPAEVRVWQEDEDPLGVVGGFLRDRKLAGRPVGIEETTRFFIPDALARALPAAKLVSADPVVRGCRMIKTPAEIALMQKATDVTIAAYRFTWERVEIGMSQSDIGALMTAATRRLGGVPGFSMALVGESAAYPHGTKTPATMSRDALLLMDCGCTVQDYQSDVSRTFVKGSPSAEIRKVWDQVRQGQQIAFAAAKLGVAAGSVDDAVRAQYERWGYGPRYKLPGLSHRTGHGIGLDGHEPVNLVHGEATRLAPGMCFSNEPGLYLPGKFGVRLEDCFYMTDAGPKWFSEPPRSIEAPLG